jgi:2-polyprenyl-3-methyl-5-hydroxy-6-metoxy-1,4-benzoquinol methylase
MVCPLCRAAGRARPEAAPAATLHRCPACALVFTWPLAVPPSLYDEAYEQRELYGTYFAVGAKAAAGDLRVPWPQRTFLRRVQPGGTLLDVGCSTGRFLAAAAARGWQVRGIERSAAAVEAASTLAPGNVRRGSIEDAGDEGGLGAVTAWEVLEHVEDPHAFLARAASLLRPGGVLGLSVPDWDSPWTRRSRAPEHWPPYHLTFWTAGPLRRLLVEAGFDVAVLARKPFAWGEELGSWKWPLLPLSLLRATLFGERGMHLLAIGRRR